MPMVVSRKRRIYFTVEGERGPNLLLLHGLLGCQRDWYDWGLAGALAPDYRLILPDLLGHGRSDKPAEAEAYALEGLADDLIEILNELDVRNATLAGCSLGAMVGFNLANRHPERVRGVFLGGSAAYPTPPFLEICREAAAQLESQPLETVVNAGREAGWAQTIFRESPEEGHREAARAMLQAIGAWEPDQTKKFAPRTAVVFFSGTADPAYERLQKARNITTRARLISLPDVRTLQALENPEQLLSELTAFAQAVRGSAGEGGREGEEPGQRARDPRRRSTQGPPGRPEARGPGGGGRRETDPGADAARPENGDGAENGEAADFDAGEDGVQEGEVGDQSTTESGRDAEVERAQPPSAQPAENGLSPEVESGFGPEGEDDEAGDEGQGEGEPDDGDEDRS